MARIKVAHLYKLLSKHGQDKISLSKVVEELNKIANMDAKCSICGEEIDDLQLAKIKKCVACFTSNA